MLLLQLKDPLELFVTSREFLPDSFLPYDRPSVKEQIKKTVLGRLKIKKLFIFIVFGGLRK